MCEPVMRKQDEVVLRGLHSLPRKLGKMKASDKLRNLLGYCVTNMVPNLQTEAKRVKLKVP